MRRYSGAGVAARFLGLTLVLFLSACFPAVPSRGGGQTEFQPPREVDAADVALPDGYQIEVVATGLTFPSGVAFDDEGRPYVIEAGYSYGEAWATPRLLRIEADGSATVVAEGENPPWNGVDFANGSFYVAEGGQVGGGRLLRISQDGETSVLLEGLPGLGDHHTNGPAVGPDGMLYFGQGTATNSAVVGPDNADFGWLHRHPEFHDTPCQDITLTGVNFESPNPLTDDPEDEVVTGAYSPFGKATEEGQLVQGEVPCTGAVLRVALEGGEPELVAWGFRNPFGLAFDGQGRLFVTDNSYDDRGSRPVFGTGDLLWRVEEGGWYGWPDFHGNRPLTDADQYRVPGEKPPGFLLAEHPTEPPEPVALLGVHSSSNGLDFSPGPEFGFEGHAFIPEFGDMAPGAGKVVAPVGFKVTRVDVETGLIEDFAVNNDPTGPASRTGLAGLERPVAVRFSPDGSSLYVVDFGVMTMIEQGPVPHPETGVLWRITRQVDE
jgi:glucose/arabinose dehydrogenase